MSRTLDDAWQLMQSSRFLEAAALCKKASRKQQDFVEAKRLLADCYNNQGLMDVFRSRLLHDAEKHFRLAIEHNPQHVEALNSLAGVLITQSRFSDSIVFLRKLVTLDPMRMSAHRDLAVALLCQHRYEEAIPVLKTLSDKMPNDGSALLREATIVESINPDFDYPRKVRERINRLLDIFEASGRSINDPTWFPGTYFYLSYHGLCNKDLHTRIASATLGATPSLAWESPHIQTWVGKAGRIRIGIASSFLYDHSIGHTTRGLVEKLDRSKFEVVVIHIGGQKNDHIAGFINQAADQVVTVPTNGGLQQSRDDIANIKLDVLFWQDIGMEPFSYLLAFARLAPVQLTSFGHPDTTGIPNIDYFLSSDLYETDESEHHYSESLVCVKGAGTLSYYYRPSPPKESFNRSKFGLSDTDHIYLCPQTLFKVHPDMDDVFLNIVQQDKLARIVLISDVQGYMRQKLQDRFARCSSELAQRVQFIARQPYEEYLGILQCANVMLDTMHFNGQNTSLEGFSLGIPIVTLPGALQRSRHTYGMYRAMGFMDLVATSKEDFASKAVAVANNPEFQKFCCDQITLRAGVLYENNHFIEECETAILAMVQQKVAQLNARPQS